MKRIARMLLVAGLTAASLAVVGGGQVASGQTGPVGYSIGQHFVNGIDDCEFFSIDVSTGATTQISDPSTEILCGDGLTFAPDGTLYAFVQTEAEGSIVETTLATIDPATGTQTPIGELPLVNNGGMTFDAAGNLWLYAMAFDPTADCAAFTSCLWLVDPATAGTTFVGSAPDGITAYGLTGSCTDVLALTAPNIAGTPTPQIQTVDTATAGFTPILPIDEMGFPTGLDFDGSGGLWALGGEPFTGIGAMQVVDIDLATGDLAYQQLFVDGNPEEPFNGILAGLAISSISCPVPPPVPDAVVITPTFTG